MYILNLEKLTSIQQSDFVIYVFASDREYQIIFDYSTSIACILSVYLRATVFPQPKAQLSDNCQGISTPVRSERVTISTIRTTASYQQWRSDFCLQNFYLSDPMKSIHNDGAGVCGGQLEMT